MGLRRRTVLHLDGFLKLPLFLNTQVDWRVNSLNQRVDDFWIFLEEVIIVNEFLAEFRLFGEFPSDLFNDHFGKEVLLVILIQVIL